MIYATPTLDGALREELADFDRLSEDLGSQARAAGLWLGSLRRQWRASSAESSIEIEGYSVPSEERLGITSGAEPADPTDDDRMALSSYARAMDHVGVMAADEEFEWVERVLLDLHFDACFFQKDRTPVNTVAGDRGHKPEWRTSGLRRPPGRRCTASHARGRPVVEHRRP